MPIADDLSDSMIEALLGRPKEMPQSERRKLRSEYWREISGHHRADIALEADGDEKFSIFIRQTVDDIMDFTVGLKAVFNDNSSLNLIRCNRVHGRYRNDLENTVFEDEFHVHITTERYIKNGAQPEKFAAPTAEYGCLDGAIEFFLKRCNVRFREEGLFLNAPE